MKKKSGYSSIMSPFLSSRDHMEMRFINGTRKVGLISDAFDFVVELSTNVKGCCYLESSGAREGALHQWKMPSAP